MCSDPKVTWYANRVVCYATRARQAAEALQAKARGKKMYHDGTEGDWSEERSLLHPYRFTDGQTIVPLLKDLTPGDDFFTPDDGDEDIADLD